MTVGPTPIQHRAPDRSHLAFVALVVLVLLVVAIWLLARFDVFSGSSSSGSVQGSGISATQTRPVAPFSSVELAGSNAVVVHVGASQSVLVRADANLLDHVTTQVHGDTLVIGNTSGSFTAKSPMRVDVEVPSLNAVRLSGSGAVSVTGVEAAALVVRLTGSGVLSADGRASRLDVALAGSGDAQLRRLVAGDVHAVVWGSGRIVVTATKSLDAAVPGSGVILYSGDPTHVTRSVTGSGSVTRG